MIEDELRTVKCILNVSDETSLTVNPPGILRSGMSIIVRCLISYGGPRAMLSTQDPTLTLTLDNEPAFPRGQTYYEPPADTGKIYRKFLVRFKRF